jgi:hypothetical protein
MTPERFGRLCLILIGLFLVSGCFRDEQLYHARKAAENAVEANFGMFARVEILGSSGSRQSEDDKKEALRNGDWGAADATIIVTVNFRLAGQKQYALVGCNPTNDVAQWQVSIFRSSVGR